MDLPTLLLQQDPQGDLNPKDPHTYPNAQPLMEQDAWGQMPPAASTFAPDVDGLFYFCFWLSVFFFFLIAGLLVYTTIQNRRKTETQPAASDMTHNTALEVVWTLIPTIILMVIFAWGWKGNLEQSIAAGQQLASTARPRQQWSWAFQHPGQADSSRSTSSGARSACRSSSRCRARTSCTRSTCRRSARSVTVLPGRYQTVWFTPTVEGDYPLFCAEYCGKDHSRMIATVHVVSKEEFDKKPWNKIPDDPIVYGEQIYNQLCIACHTLDGSKRVGPSFKGLWGREEEMTDGTRLTVNEEYVTESIRKPMAKIVKGYENAVMTAYDASPDPRRGNRSGHRLHESTLKD